MATSLQKEKRILIIDDDEMFTRILQFSLKNHGYKTYCINSTESALEFLQDPLHIDLFLLDFHLDDVTENGLSLCRRIKSSYDRPVIMLSGESSTDTKVSCLYAGADYYVLKPYVFEELLAIIHVALERYPVATPEPILGPINYAFSSLEVDGKSRTLSTGQSSVKLTERERQLAEVLFKNPEQFLPREQIYVQIFGRRMTPFNRAVDILVGRLRKKLQKIAQNVTIQASRNRGYGVFEIESAMEMDRPAKQG